MNLMKNNFKILSVRLRVKVSCLSVHVSSELTLLRYLQDTRIVIHKFFLVKYFFKFFRRIFSLQFQFTLKISH